MFDADPPYAAEAKTEQRRLLEAKDNRKVKKQLFELAKQQFSDPIKYHVSHT